MTLKIWRGDAPAVAQQTRITPGGVEIGDIFTLTINGKAVSVAATAGTAANVCTLLAAAIAASTIPEFGEFGVTNEGSTLLLTANTAGVPFVVAAATTNANALSVSVTTTTEGSAADGATNMTQTFRIPKSAGGTFTVTIAGDSTSGLAIGVSAIDLQTAIVGLDSVGGPGQAEVTRTDDANDWIYEIEFTGDLAGINIATAVVSIVSTKPIIRTTQEGSGTGTIRNEIQTIDNGDLAVTGGSAADFTLDFESQTSGAVSPETTGAGLEVILEAMSTINNVTVSKTGNIWTVEFVGPNGSANQDQLVASVYTNSRTSTHAINVVTVNATGTGSAVNEVQVVTLTGSPTGGTFTLTYSGQTTSGIAYNADAATVDSALEALTNIGTGDVAVTGSAGGPWTVTFGGALAGTNVAQITGDGANLTGGSTQTLSASDIVASSGPNHWDTAANWLPSGVPVNGDDVRFEFGSSNCLYGLAQSTVTIDSLHVSMAYSGRIGLPRINSLGYHEYRTTELTIGATEILIGHGQGSGPSKVALNVGSVATSLELRDSGGSSESGVPTVTWRGTSTSNAIEQYGGDLGLATYSDQSATVATLRQRGGTIDAKHTAFVTSLLFTSARFFNCTLDGQPIESY